MFSIYTKADVNSQRKYVQLHHYYTVTVIPCYTISKKDAINLNPFDHEVLAYLCNLVCLYYLPFKFVGWSIANY